MTPVRALSFHADYRCRHRGACCTSNWPIPIEADRLAHLRAAVANRRLRPVGGGAASPIEDVPGAPVETPAVLGRGDGRCVFYDNAPALSEGRCRIHAALGHDALPLACRQFPRVSVHDPRGVSVTLSHYCPTAAGLLDADPTAPLAIVLNAPSFPPGREYVGLDARGSLPPALRHNMLMDWESWWACERLAVEVFGASDDAARVLARLRAAVHDVSAWSPADGPLIERVHQAFDLAPTRSESVSHHALVAAVLDAIPADIRPDRLVDAASPGGLRLSDLATRRFLAAHAFGSWAIHVGAGLGVWLRSIEAAAALIEAGAGARRADLLLRHLSDPHALATALS